MAFDVTPTSGDSPYVLTAVLGNKEEINGIYYSLELYTSNQVGSCFLGVASGAVAPSWAQSLLNNGAYTVNTSVNVGSCRTYTLIIRDLTTNDVLDSKNVYIDNT